MKEVAHFGNPIGFHRIDTGERFCRECFTALGTAVTALWEGDFIYRSDFARVCSKCRRGISRDGL